VAARSRWAGGGRRNRRRPARPVPRRGDLHQLLDLEDPVAAVRDAGKLPRIGSVEEVLANSAFDRRDPRAPWLLAPCDLQAIKASGVTFVASLLERVIEEQTRGDARKAESARQSIGAIIVQHGGTNLREIRPGSPQARAVKEALIAQGIWSQYLEVGIGPDAEIFTKGQPMSAVGTGAEIGFTRSRRGTTRSPRSCWPSTAPAAPSAPRWATTSTCAISRDAARCCSARRKTTTRRRPSAHLSGCSTRISDRSTCGGAR
jgi:fumarylacetoacetate (FAA) hydrolase family protein